MTISINDSAWFVWKCYKWDKENYRVWVCATCFGEIRAQEGEKCSYRDANQVLSTRARARKRSSVISRKTEEEDSHVKCRNFNLYTYLPANKFKLIKIILRREHFR